MKTFLALSVVSVLTAAEPVRRINSQPSWILENDQVEMAITQLGGHMAPVKFQRRDAQPVQPYHISPWQDENLKISDPVLVPLRGDFFCMPFGGGREANGREHPAHGETATGRWSFAGIAKQGSVTSLTLTMETKVRPGKVTKKMMLVDGQNVVYAQHRVEGFAGKSTPGHHATLRLPDKEGAFRIASSAFAYGTTHPLAFADISQGEYQSFAVGAEFKDLRNVPSRFKDAKRDIDMTALPTERGYVNLMAIYKRPASEPGWMAAVNQQDGYVWFSLKDAAVLPGTVFWLENRGRHGAPWSGRNRCLGMEDVCWYFDKSYDANPVNKMGIPTAMTFDGAKPVVINYIQGAVKTPAGFDAVKTVEFGKGSITLVSVSGKRLQVAVQHEFLRSGQLTN